MQSVHHEGITRFGPASGWKELLAALRVFFRADLNHGKSSFRDLCPAGRPKLPFVPVHRGKGGWEDYLCEALVTKWVPLPRGKYL